MPKSPYQTLLIIGLGLIGGSLARLIRHHYPDSRIFGVETDAAARDYALSNRIVDEVGVHFSELSSDPEVAFVCVPIRHVISEIQAVIHAYPTLRVVSDVASVKGDILVSRETLGAVMFIPGHPMAGIEKKGVMHSDFLILEGAKYVVVPQVGAEYSIFCDFLTSLSFEVVEMDAKSHDRVVASVSHIPYLMAGLTVDNARAQDSRLQPFISQLKSSGYRDTTRVAASDPVWGVDICLSNQIAILAQLKAVSAHLTDLIKMVELSDQERLLSYLTAIQACRSEL